MDENKISNQGFAAIIVLMVIISLVLVVAFSVTIIVINEMKIDKNLILSAQSYYSAESGVEDAVLRVINNEYEYTAINNFAFGDADITQNITQVGDDISVQSFSSYFNNERKLEILIHETSDDISFYYGVQVGEGGLTMDNGSSINGSLYSDGSVSGSGTIIGDLIVATGMSLDGNGTWDTYNDDLIFGKNGEPTDIAVSFAPASTGELSQISFYIKKQGSPADGTIRIVEDNAGSPSSTELATTTFDVSKIGSSYGWVNFSFSSPANLTNGNTYWIIIDVTSTVPKYFYMGRASGNANSVSKYSDDWSGESWTTDTDGDYEYKAWIGGVSTSVDGLTINGTAHAHEIKNCAITGDAKYQTISNSTVGGTAYPGTPDPAVVALPISDGNISDWEADALAYGILDSSLCSVSTDTTINGGKLVCPTGFNPGTNVTIILNGTLWVEGDITLENNNKLILNSSYGNNSGVIIADNPGNESTGGKILIENNIIICGSQGLNGAEDGCADSVGSYILMLSTHSGEATYAINVKNNASGAVFYAQNGTANIKNGANLKEVTAYKLNLEENAEVTYESGLADASFTSGPGGGWVINSWNETQ
jgi:type II secretory pathway pseudopilin PulG